MKYAVLVVNGNINNFSFYEDIFKNSSMVVCSDGGANLTYKEKIHVDMIIGDLDSIDEKVLSYYKKNKSEILKYPVKKDKTDSELSLDIIGQKGIKNVVMIGYMGDRMDHILTNINLLSYAHKTGINLVIKDENNEISYIAQGETKLNIEKGKTVSFVSLSGDVNGISLEGFEYDLDNYMLKSGSSILTSNIAKSERQTVKIKQGNLIMITVNDISGRKK